MFYIFYFISSTIQMIFIIAHYMIQLLHRIVRIWDLKHLNDSTGPLMVHFVSFITYKNHFPFSPIPF